MNKLRILLFLAPLTLCGIAAAQTVYTIPAGTTCNTTVEGCYYHNLTATATDGSTLWGLFEAGGYWTQFDYQAFQGQNPGYKAQYCNGTAVWSSAAMDNGDTEFTMDCSASADQTSSDGPVTIHAVIDASSAIVSYRCGVKVSTICHRTVWTVDAGTVTITPVTASQTSIVGGPGDGH